MQNCIGAIDGTHITCVPPRDVAERYRNRHGYLSQNILAAVQFNMLFSFVMAGWEGSAHDSRLLDHARQNPELRFPKPQTG